MESTKGFYKFDNDNWLYAPNYVESTGYVLIAEDKDQYTYPVDGWVWYDRQPNEFTEFEDVTNINTSTQTTETLTESTDQQPVGFFTRIRNFFGI